MKNARLKKFNIAKKEKKSPIVCIHVLGLIKNFPKNKTGNIHQ